MAAENETISLAIATRNRAHMLNETLKSLEKQRIVPHEIVVVDNASSDETSQVVERMQRRLPINYQYCPKIGINPARNYALKKCAGDIICFIDDDLYCDHELVAAMLNFFKQRPGIAAVQGYVGNYYPERLVASVAQFSECTVASIRCRNGDMVLLPTMITTQLFALRRRIIQDYNIAFDETLERGGDRDFAHQIMKRGLKIGYEKKAIVLHKDWSRSCIGYLKRRILYGKARATIVRKHGTSWIEKQNKRMGWLGILKLAFNETNELGAAKRTAAFLLIGLGHILNRISYFYYSRMRE